jgi:hypothetical protein
LITEGLEKIKNKPVIENSERKSWRNEELARPYDTFSVYSIPAWHFWIEGECETLEDVWECCKLFDSDRATPEQIELANTPLDLLYEKRGVHIEGHVM